MVYKILIANRGEIAIRIARSIRELGFIPLGIYTETDSNSYHRRFMNEDRKVSSYLSIEDILESAEYLGADAIHPGYGFLSENPEFAKRVIRKGFTWIGPNPKTMKLAGDKIEAKKIARKIGIPTLDYKEVKTADDILEFAKEHDFPSMIKAVGGGGGMGMRIIKSPEEAEKMYELAKKEAEGAFGDPRLYVEPCIKYAKHIEVQILGYPDYVIHLYERDCSIQRRHQKIIEEAPAPYLSSKVRKAILNDAVRLMKEIGYTNAGTVEFLYDLQRGKYYFMEINARLQVEHPVTEMITGIDIVKHQIYIALDLYGRRGTVRKLKQEDIKPRGHAIEARIYAEDLNFNPSFGTITNYKEPSGPWIRVDSGVTKGSEVSTEYNPMISKLIVYGMNRQEAIRRLERALKEYQIKGVQTNIPLLQAIIESREFRNGKYTTRFIDKNYEKIINRIRKKELLHVMLALAVMQKDRKIGKRFQSSPINYPVYQPVNGVNNRIAAIKRKAWAYWIALKGRTRRKY